MMRQAARRLEQGFVLVIAMVALIIMTLGGIALARSVDVGGMIAGNLAFRQSAVSASDIGVGATLDWINATSATDLQHSDAAAGYFASWGSGFNPASFNWNDRAILVPTGPGSAAEGYEVRYVVHRMCRYEAGDTLPSGTTSDGNHNDPENGCLIASNTSSSGFSTKAIDYSGLKSHLTETTPYYRVTVRTVGPRDTMAYVQVMVY